MRTAADGTQIPVSMVYRKDLRQPGPQPLLLSGYGAYGFPSDVHFSSTRLSLLDRGVIFAIAHVRGGGEMGKKWHDQGRMLNKKNTFTDFIAAAEHLIAQQTTRRAQLVDRGRQRRRTADGRGGQPAARSVQGRGGRGAVRRRDQHHARRQPAADHRRVRGVGQSAGPGVLRVHAVLLALRQHRAARPIRRCWWRPRSTTAR